MHPGQRGPLYNRTIDALRDPGFDSLRQRLRSADRTALLRPLSPSEVIDLGFRVFRAVGWSALRVTVLPVTLCGLVLAFFSGVALPSLFETRRPGDIGAQLVEMGSVLAVTVLIALPLVIALLSYCAAAMCRLVSAVFAGEPPDEVDALRVARRHLGTMVGFGWRSAVLGLAPLTVSLLLLMLSAWITAVTPETAVGLPALIALLATGGLLAGFSVPLVVFSRFALAPPVIALEGLGAREAMRRSTELLAGMRPRIPSGYDALVLLWLVEAVVAVTTWIGLQIGFGLLGVSDRLALWIGPKIVERLVIDVASAVPAFVTTWVVVLVWCAATTVLYYDRRARREGYDIERLHEMALRTGRRPA